MRKFISLKTKIMVGFTIIFSISFAGSFYWFYRFMIHETIHYLRRDLEIVLINSARRLDTDELMTLAKEGKSNKKRLSDDLRYQNQLRFFETIQYYASDVKLFTFTKGNKPNEIIYLVDGWANIDLEKTAKFLESAEMTEFHRRTLIDGNTEYRNLYKDKWGSWLTVYTPIYNHEGVIVAGLGGDIEGSYIRQLKKGIALRVIGSFLLCYPLILAILYWFSHVLTARMRALGDYAIAVGEGDYSQQPMLMTHDLCPDERLIIY